MLVLLQSEAGNKLASSYWSLCKCSGGIVWLVTVMLSEAFIDALIDGGVEIDGCNTALGDELEFS